MKALEDCTPGYLADTLYKLRQNRLKIEALINESKAEERRIKDHLIKTLTRDELTRIAGKVAGVSVVTSDQPRALDWALIWAHVKKTGHFELLHKRLSAEACRERWEQGIELPGVERFKAIDLSVNALKK